MSRFSVVFLLMSTVLFGASNNNIPALQGFPTVPLLPCEQAFNNIKDASNTQEVTDFIEAERQLKRRLFSPLLDMGDIQDQTPLLKRLRAIRTSLQGCNPRIVKFVNDLFERINFRIKLAHIDQNIYDGHGKVGTLDHSMFNQRVKSSLAFLTGKIFHIKRSLLDNGTINERVKVVGSGMLVSLTDTGKASYVNNLTPNSHQLLNGVLTCSHVIDANQRNEETEAYFVPTRALHLVYGLPLAINAVALPSATEENLKYFLRHNIASFRITNYTLWKRCSPAFIQTFQNNAMDVTQPRFLNNEDIVVANIIPNAGAAISHYNCNATVNFIAGTPAINDLVNSAHFNEYFAMGYPGCPQYRTGGLTGFSQDLINRFGISPLFITQAFAKQAPLVVGNGQIRHSAAVAPGMSGGPLFAVNEGTINVLGVISQGEDGNEIACNLG